VGDEPAELLGKRERLVIAACELLHHRGVEATTLADIAQAADVPLGNVYYYFKTKDEIVAAVARAHVDQIEAMAASLERGHRTPKSRLKALVRMVAGQREPIAQYGCPYGTLCADLAKREGEEPSERAAQLMTTLISWTEQQLVAMGRRDAHDLAVEIIVAYQGSALVASALGDATFFTEQMRRVEKRIDAL